MKRSRRSAALVALTAAAVVASSPGAWALDVKGSLVKSTKTSEWETPSPDPSGIGYNVNTKRFLISDGEVEEMTIFKGVNIYDAETSGALVGTAVTLPWSAEPTGIAVNPNNGEIYVSDDDKRSVFVLQSLKDASPGVIGKAKFTAHGVDPDLEGVGYDSKRNEILLANGERGAGFWRVKPGGDGMFGTGDDVVMPKILIEQHGGVDPEGIAYDAVRDTVVMVDGSANKIFEMDETGALINTIGIGGLGMDAPAGIEVAPASNGSSARHYYIVDRGVDNNSDPNENDGMLYEVAAQLGDVGANQPPTANAGSDQVTTVGGTVTLAGSATDLEAGALSYSWKRQTGPQGVTLGTPNAATTTATFTEAGTFVLRLTVTDSGGLTAFDDVTVTVGEEGRDLTVSRAVLASGDDAAEGSASGGKFVDVTTKQNPLGMRQPGTGEPYPVITGLRFPNIPVPKGGTVQSATIQFKVDEVTTGPASLTLKGEASDNAAPFAGSGNISGRAATQASVAWSPADWTEVNSTGPEAKSPDLKSILQEIVDQPGWAAGNAVAIMVSGDGRRAAKAWDAGAQHAPVLTITYTTGQTAPAENKTPTVDAGADLTVTLPAGASLDGTVTDDGLPKGGTLTTEWSKLSGPGKVTFGDPAKVDTTATFGEAGEYVLRLTANDGALSTSDDVKVTVKAASTTPPPGGGGGGGGGGTPPPAPTPEPPTTPTPPPADVETEVTLQATHGAIRHGGTVRLGGMVTADDQGVGGATVELYVSRDGGDFELLDSGQAAGDGSFSFEDQPDVSSEYVARSGGSSSAAIAVTVRPRLGAKLRHGMVKAGTRTAVVGFVSPAADGHVLRLQKRFGSTWRTVRTISVSGGERTRFRFMVRPKVSRAHWYRVVSPAQAGRGLAVVGGKQLRLQAYNATVKRVLHRADVVVVRNTGRVAFSLEGWMLLERRSGQRVGLPDFTVRPGRIVRIHSGAGAGDRRNLHLGTGEMWAPRGVAVLRDARLRLADRLRF